MNKAVKTGLVVVGVGTGAYALYLAGRYVSGMMAMQQAQARIAIAQQQAAMGQRYGMTPTQQAAIGWTNFGMDVVKWLYSFGSEIHQDYFSGNEVSGGNVGGGNQDDVKGYVPTEFDTQQADSQIEYA